MTALLLIGGPMNGQVVAVPDDRTVFEYAEFPPCRRHLKQHGTDETLPAFGTAVRHTHRIGTLPESAKFPLTRVGIHSSLLDEARTIGWTRTALKYLLQPTAMTIRGALPAMSEDDLLSIAGEADRILRGRDSEDAKRDMTT